MKIRLGFVSNSSSSSFLCNICGSMEVIYDDGDLEVSCCGNGHSFCVNCIKELNSNFEIVAAFVESFSKETFIFFKDNHKKTINSVKDISILTEAEIDNFINTFDIDSPGTGYSGGYGSNYSLRIYDGIPEKLCPICTLEIECNSGQSAVSKFAQMTQGITEKEILKIIRKQYGSLKLFEEAYENTLWID